MNKNSIWFTRAIFSVIGLIVSLVAGVSNPTAQWQVYTRFPLSVDICISFLFFFSLLNMLFLKLEGLD